MIQALDPKAPFTHICKGDKKNPTKWKIKRATITEENFICDMALNVSNDKSPGNVFGNTIVTLAIGLLGAENFKLHDKDAVWERDNKADDILPGVKPWTEETLMQIPREIRDELAGVIIAGGRVIDLKNS